MGVPATGEVERLPPLSFRTGLEALGTRRRRGRLSLEIALEPAQPLPLARKRHDEALAFVLLRDHAVTRTGIRDRAAIAVGNPQPDAVGLGPGSFTSTRIGLAYARGLGLALGVPAARTVVVTVRITDAAYVVQSSGTPANAIPRGSDGPSAAVAWDQLANALAEFVAAHPGAHDVRIVAEATTRYEVIISVMDLARAVGLSQAGLQGEEAS